MMAANLRLDNLLVFVDLNDFGGLERMSESHTAFYPIREKFESFGWESAEVNGHDCLAIHQAVSARRSGRPYVLLCKTVKGRGVAFMEHVPIWHYRSPNKEEYATAIRDLVEVRS
jgi:transketolase